MPRLIIYAINVHQGGGAVLLSDLLRAIPPDLDAIVFADERMSFPSHLPNNLHIEHVHPTLKSRFISECRLALFVKPGDRVLCFGNLPPLFKLHSKTIVFLQNKYLVDPAPPTSPLPFKSQIRIFLERAWLSWRRNNASLYIVQTRSMERLVLTRLKCRVVCLPFAPVSSTTKVASRDDKLFDFIYVASGEPHKNHSNLISAWGVLSEEGFFPSLALTLSPEAMPELCKYVAREKELRGLQIHNLGVLPHDQLLSAYLKSGALIYPSTFESFGLPLIEARQVGLAVLAPELDYVRDVIDPDETFDPHSPISIARAVRRYCEGQNSHLEPHSSQVFLDYLLSSNV